MSIRHHMYIYYQYKHYNLYASICLVKTMKNKLVVQSLIFANCLFTSGGVRLQWFPVCAIRYYVMRGIDRFGGVPYQSFPLDTSVKVT